MPRAPGLVREQLRSHRNLVQVVLSPGVELAEVAPDVPHGETQLVGEPETRPAQGLERWLGTELADHVDLALHLLPSLPPVVLEVRHGDLLTVYLAVVINQLLEE